MYIHDVFLLNELTTYFPNFPAEQTNILQIRVHLNRLAVKFVCNSTRIARLIEVF